MHADVPEEFGARLTELRAILAAIPEVQRLQAIGVYGGVLRSEIDSRERAYRRAQAEREGQIREDRYKADERRDRKDGARKFSVSAVLGSLLSVAIVGLLLGLLAVERNTRALGAVVERLTPALAPDPVTPAETEAEEEVPV